MDLHQIVQDAITVVKLDQKRMQKISKSDEGLLNGVVLILVVGLIVGATLAWNANRLGELEQTPAFVMGLILPAIMLGGLFLQAGVLYLFSLLFGGSGKFIDYVKVLAHVEILALAALLTIIPFFGAIVASLVDIWGLVVAIVITKKVRKISMGAAAATVLIPFFLVVGFVILLLLLIGIAAYTGALSP